jgi:hypothetical protein
MTLYLVQSNVAPAGRFAGCLTGTQEPSPHTSTVQADEATRIQTPISNFLTGDINGLVLR